MSFSEVDKNYINSIHSSASTNYRSRSPSHSHLFLICVICHKHCINITSSTAEQYLLLFVDFSTKYHIRRIPLVRTISANLRFDRGNEIKVSNSKIRNVCNSIWSTVRSLTWRVFTYLCSYLCQILYFLVSHIESTTTHQPKTFFLNSYIKF